MPDNQTLQEWLDAPSVADDPDAQGTGAFLNQYGDKGYVPEITYGQLIENDQKDSFRAFAWVPHAVASEDEVKNAQCGGRCVKVCKKPGCLCDRSMGMCK